MSARSALLFICILCCLITCGQTLQFRHYTANDGLCSNTVYYSLQDSKGYVWFCTEAGVNRFDGAHFESFTVKDGLADNDNFRCVEDHKGRLWLSGYNGKLCYFNGSSFKNETSDTSLRSADTTIKFINGMLEDPKGMIWFSKYDNEHIYAYNGKAVRRKKTVSGFSQPGYLPVNRLFYNHNDTACFLDVKYGSLFRFNAVSGAATHLVFPQYKAFEAVMRPYIQTVGNASFFLSTEGLRHICNDSVFADVTNTGLASGNTVMISAFLVTNGHLWLGTNEGLFLVRDFEKKGFNGQYERYLQGVSIGYIGADNEGGAWFNTMSEGVFYLPASQSYITNIPIKSATAIRHSRYKNHYGVGTYYGDFILLADDKIIQNKSFRLSGPSRVKKIRWISPDEVLVGIDPGLYRYSISKQKKSIFLNKGDSLHFAFTDTDEGVAGRWVAGRELIFLCGNKKQQLVYGRQGQLEEKLISITEGGAAGCWFTSVNRLHWLALKTGTKQIIADEKVFGANLKDTRQAKAHLWVATDGNGIFIFKNSKPVAHLHTGNTGLASNICQKLMPDTKNRMWVATNKGISVFDIHTYKVIMSFTTTDMLINTDVKDLDVYDNKVYAATASGVSVIDLDKFVATTLPPKVYIKAFTANGINYAATAAPAFNYFNGIIKLKYIAITFQSRETIVYRYKINNKDTLWNETTAEELEFYSLQPGAYELALCAKKYNSSWSAPFTFSFTVLPLWYQTMAFKILLFCLVIVLIALIAWLINSSQRRKSDIKRRVLESELKAIRLYMNPHFIFNSLSSLQLYILKNKSPEAGTYVSKFAKLIRWIMTYSEKQEITLGDEIEFLKTYIELEQSRFDNGFILQLSIEEKLDVKQVSIPPLVMQPIVENAIKYGLSGKKEAGILQISFAEKNGLIFASVRDNGVGRAKVMQEQALSPNKTPSTGLKYTEERLRLLLKGHKVGFPVITEDLFEAGIASGTCVQLIIPIIQ